MSLITTPYVAPDLVKAVIRHKTFLCDSISTDSIQGIVQSDDNGLDSDYTPW